MDQHFLHSSFREKLIEHVFIGELLKLSWLSGECSLEVAKPEVDSRGYDDIIERAGVVRHIQLKASAQTARAASQKIHVGLAEKPSGCVVWIQFDPSTLELGPFLFSGDAGGRPLPDLAGFKVSKHTKGNADGKKPSDLAYAMSQRDDSESLPSWKNCSTCCSSRHPRMEQGRLMSLGCSKDFTRRSSDG